MQGFEIIYNGGTSVEVTAVHPYQVALWQRAFDRESLAGLFDITPAAAAISVLDAALARFQTHAAELRTVLDPADWLGLRGNRRVLERMRATLADHPDATISGTVDDEADQP